MVNPPCTGSISVLCPYLSIFYLNTDTCKNPDNTATAQPEKKRDSEKAQGKKVKQQQKSEREESAELHKREIGRVGHKR